jgi:ABC-type branched-subunit amino acid transport system substrate-binding protein
MPVNTISGGNSRRNSWRALAGVLIPFCLLLTPSPHGHAAAAQEKSSGAHDADRHADSPSVIRLGMSADFTAGARALGIELFRGAMAYVLPVNAAGGVNGRHVVIKPYDDQYDPDLAIRNTVKLMDQDNVFALLRWDPDHEQNAAPTAQAPGQGFLTLIPL